MVQTEAPPAAVTRPAAGRHRPLRWQPLVVLAALGCVLFVVYYLRSRAASDVNADGAAFLLQAHDMLHGDWNLSGWWTSDMPVYTTEVPEYALIEAFRGMVPDVVHIAAALTFTLVMVLLIVLAKGRARGREAWVRMLIAGGIAFAPYSLPSTVMALNIPDHMGTMVPLLAALIVLDRWPERWSTPVIVGAVLTWTEIADQLVVYIGAVPLAIVCAIRLYRRLPSWRIDAALLGAAGASVPIALGALKLLTAMGGMHVPPADPWFATTRGLASSLWTTLECLLSVFSADFLGLRLTQAKFEVLHLVCLALVCWAVAIACRRFFHRSDRLTPILALGIVLNIAALLLGTQAADVTDDREILAVLVLGAVLAGRVLPSRVEKRHMVPVLTAIFAVFGAVLLGGATRPAAAQGDVQLTQWLEAHDLTSGIGSYWVSSTTTMLSGERIVVRPVSSACNRYVPYYWESRQTWYDPDTNDANFVVLNPKNGAGGTLKQVIAYFGKPQTITKVGDNTVIVYDRNLIPALQGPYPSLRCTPGEFWLTPPQ